MTREDAIEAVRTFRAILFYNGDATHDGVLSKILDELEDYVADAVFPESAGLNNAKVAEGE